MSHVAAVESSWQHCASLTSLKFKPETSSSKDERVTAWPFGRYKEHFDLKIIMGDNEPRKYSCLKSEH